VSVRLHGRLSEFRNEIRWTIVVLVLAVFAIVALWPRNEHPSAGGPDGRGAQPVASRPVDPAQRAAAGLLPCPTSTGTARASALAGAMGTCLSDGFPSNLAAAVSGRPTLINVWATWCEPCRTELPALQAYSQQPGAVQVLGVQVQSDQADGLDLLKRLGVRFPSVHDDDDRIAAALRAPNLLPASFVVTTSGEVRRVDPPVVFASPDDVRTAVRRTLGAVSE
jgi:thiol-disulfide isomerase/thioredoxin